MTEQSRGVRWIRLTVKLWPVVCAVERVHGFPVAADVLAKEFNQRGIASPTGGRWRVETAARVLAWSRFGERIGGLERPS